jgi:hypothetical protein
VAHCIAKLFSSLLQSGYVYDFSSSPAFVDILIEGDFHMVMHPRFGEGLAKAVAPVVAPALVTTKAALLGSLTTNPVGLTVLGVVALGAAATAIAKSKQNK